MMLGFLKYVKKGDPYRNKGLPFFQCAKILKIILNAAKHFRKEV